MLTKEKILHLQEQGLINVKEQGDLLVVKYKNKVFYKDLWNEDKDLVETRGLILDHDFNPVAVPFHKVFNYRENGTTLDRDMKVTAVRKVNGFLGCLTYHNDKPLVSTTGSTDSPFSELATKVLHETMDVETFLMENDGHNYTFMFEICDPTDPHIIPENAGAWLIGAREKTLRKRSYMREQSLDMIAADQNIPRPEHFKTTFGELVDSLSTCPHEGYMVRGPSGNIRLKLKSPYYLMTKFMGRGKEKLRNILKDPKAARRAVDEEFYSVVDFLHDEYGVDTFIDEYTPEQRIEIVREFFDREVLG